MSPKLVSIFGIEPHRIGGTEMFARELSMQLGQQGWDSVLCFLSLPDSDVRSFLDLPNTSFEVYASTADGSWKTARNMMEIVSRHRPDILHLHYIGFVNPYSWIAILKGVKQVFFTDHHSRPFGAEASRAPAWKRLAARAINLPLSKVICVSNYGYECMTATDLIPRRRFTVIYNGVDLTRVSDNAHLGRAFRERYSIPADRAVVTQVSWMIPEKGIADFLATARAVISVNDRVHFVLVGDGSYREQYMREAAAMGLSDHVTFTGLVSDPFSAGVFHAADVICQFSRWEEVFGWMIAEAMAHAKPVIATRVGGIPELISDGVNGYLVERGDSAAMSKCLLELLGDANLRMRMGSAARQVASTKFELRKKVTQLMQAYGIVQPCRDSKVEQESVPPRRYSYVSET